MGKYEEALERAKAGKPIDEVFPELKESEDERIRKAIGAAICGTTAISILEANGTNLPDALSYLEKQKEPLTPEEKMNHPLYLEGFDVGREVGEVVAKPAEWSDEDRMKIVELKTFIAQCNGFNKENRKKAFDMIDALCPHPHWKPSEEQIQVFKQTLTNFIEDCIAENLENTTPENKDNHEGYHQACWDILYFIKQASK